MNIINLSLLDLDGYGFKAINAVNSQLKNLRSVTSKLQYLHQQLSLSSYFSFFTTPATGWNTDPTLFPESHASPLYLHTILHHPGERATTADHVNLLLLLMRILCQSVSQSSFSSASPHFWKVWKCRYSFFTSWELKFKWCRRRISYTACLQRSRSPPPLTVILLEYPVATDHPVATRKLWI